MDIENCTSFSMFQRKRASLTGSFAEFCMKAASSYVDNVEVDASSDIMIRDDHQDTNQLISNAYKKRDMFINCSEMVSKRLNQSLNHGSVSKNYYSMLFIIKLILFQMKNPNAKNARCVVCCSTPHDGTKPDHSRHGYKTKFICPVCLVPLCHKPRIDQLPCNVIFHNHLELPDVCKNSHDMEIHRRVQANRAPPPKRSRSSYEGNNGLDEVEDTAENSRSTSVLYSMSRRPRRSLRLSSN